MQQILVGRFRNPADAEVAMSLLVADGIPADNIEFREHGPRRRRYSSDDAQAGRLLHGVGHFFDRLFAGRSDEEDYAEPVPPGGAVIVVRVHPGHKSRLAHAALADMGATEIEQR